MAKAILDNNYANIIGLTQIWKNEIGKILKLV